MVPSKEMVEAIVKTLNESELEVKKMLQFGSSLDPEKFNNHSDIDFLVLVASVIPLGDNSLPGFVLEDLDPENVAYLFRRQPQPETADWDKGREVHLLVTPERKKKNLLKSALTKSGKNGNVSAGIALKQLFPREN